MVTYWFWFVIGFIPCYIISKMLLGAYIASKKNPPIKNDSKGFLDSEFFRHYINHKEQLPPFKKHEE